MTTQWNRTRRSMQRTARRTVSALLAALLLSACAATQHVENDLKQRAQARWDALLAGDYDAAYAFYSPGYRSSHSRVDFELSMRTHRVQWDSAEVLESSCEADVCTVVAMIGYEVAQAVPGVSNWKSKTRLVERWVRTEGQWWFLPED